MSGDVLEKSYGRVVSMVRQTFGSILTAPAAIADTVLSVTSTDDFDKDGGQVVHRGEIYDYIEIDEVALTVTLDTGLIEAAEEDDFLELFDPEVEGIVVEYIADILLDDQDPGDEPIEVTVQHGLVDYLAERVRGRASEAVTLLRDGDDDWVIWQIDGKLAVDIAVDALTGGYIGTLQDIFDDADAAAAAAAAAASDATTALTAANGKNKVTVSLSSPGTAANSAGDVWFRKESATQTIIEQWQGLGGTSWQQVTLNNQVIANLDAGKLVAGSAFTNSLSVKTNFTLGDASTNGVIQSYNFAGSSVGVYIDKFGLVAKGGSVAAADIIGCTITASGGSVTATLSGSASPSASAALSFSGSGFSHSLYSSSSKFTLYSNNGAMITAPTVEIYAEAVTQSPTTFLGRIAVPGIDSSGSIVDSSLAGTFADASINTNGRAVRTTSSERFKTDIEPVDFNEADVLAMQEVTFRYVEAEEYGDCIFVGLIAEQLIACGMGAFVFYDQDGLPEGIHYPKLVVALLNVARKHRTALDDLITRIEALEASA